MKEKRKIFQGKKIKDPVKLRTFDLTENQQKLVDLITNKDSKIVFIDGPAGTAKSFISTYCGLLLMNEKKISDIVYVRSIIESASRSMGSLPGIISEKFEPFIAPLMDKLEELTPQGGGEIRRLQGENRINCIPINFLRGASFNAKYIFLDEAQNMIDKELITALTRLGEFSKMIIAGDSFQSDINGNSGFKKIYEKFDDEESRERGIYVFKFTKEDIIRSEILSFIIEKLEESKATQPPKKAAKRKVKKVHIVPSCAIDAKA